MLGQPQVVAAQINLGESRICRRSIETTLTNADLTNLFQHPPAEHRRADFGSRKRNDHSKRQSDRRRRQLLARGSVRHSEFFRTEFSCRRHPAQRHNATRRSHSHQTKSLSKRRRLPVPAPTSFSTAPLASGAGGTPESQRQRRSEPARAERYLTGLLLLGHGEVAVRHQRHFRRPACASARLRSTTVQFRCCSVTIVGPSRT